MPPVPKPAWLLDLMRHVEYSNPEEWTSDVVKRINAFRAALYRAEPDLNDASAQKGSAAALMGSAMKNADQSARVGDPDSRLLLGMPKDLRRATVPGAPEGAALLNLPSPWGPADDWAHSTGAPRDALYLSSIGSLSPGYGRAIMQTIADKYPGSPIALHSMTTPETLDFYINRGFLPQNPPPGSYDSGLPLMVLPEGRMMKRRGGYVRRPVRMAAGGQPDDGSDAVLSQDEANSQLWEGLKAGLRRFASVVPTAVGNFPAEFGRTARDVGDLASRGAYSALSQLTPLGTLGDAARAAAGPPAPRTRVAPGLAPPDEAPLNPYPEGSPESKAYEAVQWANPLYSPSLVGRAAGILGRLGAEGVARGMRGEGPLASALGLARAGTMNVVKPEGGQWLADPGKILQERLRYGADAPDAGALNAWIGGPLRKYVMNRMASPSDELRLLADQGVTHLDPGNLEHGWPPRPSNLVAKTELGRGWEHAADQAVRVRAASDVANDYPSLAWLQKLGENEPVSELRGNNVADLGFGGLTDFLRTQLESGALRPGNLNRLSVADAVQRMNDAREAETARLANMAAPVKEYPGDPRGMRWVEIKKMDPTDEQRSRLNARNWSPDADDTRADLQRQLDYEGDQMGHCVGQYCDAVASGDTRIFSLRDKGGRPHVTVEVQPPKTTDEMEHEEFLDRLDDDQREGLINAARGEFGVTKRDARNMFEMAHPDIVQLAIDLYDIKDDAAPSIVQIRGKQNAAPAKEYLPYVQDFVRTQGPWADVQDLENVGLRRTSDTIGNGTAQRFFRDAANPNVDRYQSYLRDLQSTLGEYHTPEEFERFHQGWLERDVPDENPDGLVKGHAAGGHVTRPPSEEWGLRDPAEGGTMHPLARAWRDRPADQDLVADEDPSDAQKEAGNYKKGHLRVHGLRISIENPHGSTRSGVDPDGKAWSVTMRGHYGYVRGTTGKDKDHLDALVLEGTPSSHRGDVHVINQRRPSGHFDEHKIVIGAKNLGDAVRAYRANYSDDVDRVKSTATLTHDGFRDWIENGDHQRELVR